jgi:Protein of unknown function (DUF3307)
MPLLIKLFLAHLLGDFVFQPTKWVAAKEQHQLKAWQLYVHVLIHGLILLVLVWDRTFILPGIIIVVSHFAFDVLKLRLQKPSSKRLWFLIDQSLHTAVLILVWFWVANPTIDFGVLNDPHVLVIITAIVFLTTPTSVIVKNTISKWTPTSHLYPSADSLENAGRYIGILERLFVFVFVVSNNWEGIGFLIAAKSIFRFGDLKESSDLKLTEYILIGTLLSFGIAFGIGLLCLQLMKN